MFIVLKVSTCEFFQKAEIALAEAARETVRLPILTLLYIVSLNLVFYIEHVIIKIPV